MPCSTQWSGQGAAEGNHTKGDCVYKCVCVSWNMAVVAADKEQVDWWLISCGCLADWDSLAAVTLMNYTAVKNTLHSDYCQRDWCVRVCVCVVGLMACMCSACVFVHVATDTLPFMTLNCSAGIVFSGCCQCCFHANPLCPCSHTQNPCLVFCRGKRYIPTSLTQGPIRCS